MVGFEKNYLMENQFAKSGCPILRSIDYIVFIYFALFFYIVHYLVEIGNVSGSAKGFQIGRMGLSKFANIKLLKIIILL